MRWNGWVGWVGTVLTAPTVKTGNNCSIKSQAVLEGEHCKDNIIWCSAHIWDTGYWGQAVGSPGRFGRNTFAWWFKSIVTLHIIFILVFRGFQGDTAIWPGLDFWPATTFTPSQFYARMFWLACVAFKSDPGVSVVSFFHSFEYRFLPSNLFPNCSPLQFY